MNKYDIIKGIGIISVVIGHVMHGSTPQVIYIFHMPLFFFLSGYFFKKQSLDSFFIKKSVSLLVPYVSYLLILGLGWSLVGFVKNVIILGEYDLLKFYLKIFAKNLYGGQLLKEVTGVFWFVTCLFFTQQLYNAISGFKERTVNCIVMLLYLLSIANSFYYTNTPFPLGINVVALATTYFHLGCLYKRIQKPRGKLFFFVAIGLSLAGIIMKIYGVNIGVDMKYAQYGIPVFNVIVPVFIILLLLKISEFIAKVDCLSFCFGHIGRASMTIMFLHQLFHLRVLSALGMINNQWLIIILSILFPLAIHGLLKRTLLFQVLFLGNFKKAKDLAKAVLFKAKRKSSLSESLRSQ